MDAFVPSTDGVMVHYEVSGSAPTALVFVHGWLGSTRWWDAQRDRFCDRYTVVPIDLPGHGRSGRARTAWSARQYADDIRVVVDAIGAASVVLVGHSMAGAYVVEAAPRIPATRMVVLVDTLKDLDQVMTYERAEELLFRQYRRDFPAAIENVLSRFLFAATTPPHVAARLKGEFVAHDPELAIRVLEPLYRMDVRESAARVTVPVRAINSDYTPTNVEGNRRSFRDYACAAIADTGHYPMLERPDEFNRLLEAILASAVAG